MTSFERDGLSMINIVEAIKELIVSIDEFENFSVYTAQDYFMANYRTIENSIIIHIPNFAGVVKNRTLKKVMSIDIEIAILFDHVVVLGERNLENFFASLYYTEILSEKILSMKFERALSLESVEVAAPPMLDEVNNVFGSVIRLNIREE